MADYPGTGAAPPAAPRPAPDRNLGLDLVRATEAAALAAARLMGRGDQQTAEEAAITGMRLMMESLPMDGLVVIGEGEKGRASRLYHGELLGEGHGPAVDVAIDAIDGRKLAAKGLNGALAAAALADRGSIFDPGPCRFVEKIAVGEQAAGVIDISVPVAENLRRIADAKRSPISDLTVVILDRPRNEPIIDEVREVGARVKFIFAGEVGCAISAARSRTSIDVLLGIGGTAEAVVAACALKCLGGALQARLAPQNDSEREEAIAAGYDLGRVMTTDDLVSGANVFFAATGITDGDLLAGVRYDGDTTLTESIVMGSRSGTVRMIAGEHRREKLMRYSSIEY
ncbi:MAG: class II fructose-bisphosphatase [Acidimicrobiia bacterium]